MKITGYKTYMVPPRWLFLKIETDEGIAGWGEPVIEGKAASVETAVHEFMDQLLVMIHQLLKAVGQKNVPQQFYRGGPILMSKLLRVLTKHLGISKGKRWDSRSFNYWVGQSEIKSKCILGGR